MRLITQKLLSQKKLIRKIKNNAQKNFFTYFIRIIMIINNINTNRQTAQNFNGAYIVNGSAKSVSRFFQEIKLQTIINSKTPDTAAYRLCDIYSNTQPYVEYLICTADHIKNIKVKQALDSIFQQKKLEQFAEDFNSWSQEKKQKLYEGFFNAISKIMNNEIDIKAPGEKEMTKGNSDIFLDWYSDTIKKSNRIYEDLSYLGDRFPAKIRRLDADKVTDAIIGGNFNIKEGFFRNPKNPKVEIEEDANNNVIRYVNDKIDSIVNYQALSLDGKIKMLESYTKMFYDKAGKLMKSTTRDYNGRLIKSEKYQ